MASLMKMNYENIIGQKVKSVRVLNWMDSDKESDLIQTKIIETAGDFILIEVNNEFDDLNVIIVDHIQIKDTKFSQMTESPLFEKLIDQRVQWTWLMTNNRGYKDGFQIELSKDNNQTFVQFVAMASKIEISIWNK